MDGYSYDANGNVLNDGVHSYAYDAENRIISVDGGATTYVYDANGQRVRKTVGGASTDYVYDLSGHAVAEVNASGWQRGEVYTGGRHIATYVNSTTYFDHGDWLGTERVRTAVNGSVCESITSLPFGDGQSTTGSCAGASTRHFTGKERDPESNLDYFGARYYSSSMGRFMSADWAAKATAVPYANFGDPQSLNLYSYVGNNPLLHFDPDGHCWPVSACVAVALQGVKRALQSPRVREGIEGTFNVAVGAVKFNATLASLGAAPDTGGVSLLGTAYGAVSSAGNVAAGTIQLEGSATGNVQETQRGAKLIGTVTTVSGALTLMKTGDEDQASKAAALESAFTLNPRDLAEGSTVDKILKGGDFVNTVGDAFKSLQNLISPTPPPPPPPPLPPPQTPAPAEDRSSGQ